MDNSRSRDNEQHEYLTQWKEKYEYCLSLEFSDPAYFAMHHLLVITYLLQTDGYQPDYRHTAINLLGDWLNERITTDDFRASFNNAPKKGTILKAADQQHPFLYDWNKDILTVPTGTAAVYAAGIREWAKDVLEVVGNNRLRKNG